MPSNFTGLKITFFDETANYLVTRDITDEVIGMPLFTDTGSGEVNEAEIELSGAFGQFINQDDLTQLVIDEYDRIRIEVFDLKGNKYDRFFEVKPSWLPTETSGEGTMLTLDLIGIEYHTQQVHFSRAFWFADAFDVAREIGQVYEDNRGPRQPDLLSFSVGYSQASKVGNGFPRSTVNHYEFGLHEDFCYNYWLDQLDKLGGSVDRGGVLDFFDIAFETPNVDEIQLAIFSQGSRLVDFDDDANLPTIVKTDQDINLGEQEGGLSAGTGTNVASWGAPKRGSLPTGHSKYESGIFQFVFRPVFNIGITYTTNSKVKFDDKHYISLSDSNTGNQPDVSPGDWSQIDMGDEFGDTIEYSEWTANKVQHWKNCGSNATDKNSVTDGITTFTKASGELAPGMFDCNIVINDNNLTGGGRFFRTYVDARARTDADILIVANKFAYSGAVNLFPRGFRILVDGLGTGQFANADINGVDFDNNIAEWDGDGNFIVKYRVADVGTDLDKMQVAVWDDGVIWFWDQGTTTWLIQTGDLAHECFHVYDSLVQSPSFDPKPAETDGANYPEVTKDNQPFAKNVDSAIKVTYDTSSLLVVNRLTDGRSSEPTGPYNKFGAWLCFRFPFSPMNEGGVFVGDVYGTATPSANFPGLEPSTFTSLNMDFDSRGLAGFNNATSEDFGQANSLAFVCQINAIDNFGNDLDGINQIRICMGDIVDNVVFQDYEVPFVNRFFPLDLPISGFSIYRARKPVYFSLSGNDIADQILPKELSIQNQFEWRNIKWITIHTLLGYDQFGRYSPEAKGIIEETDVNNTTLIKFVGGDISLQIDDFHWTKPLLAIARETTDRNLEPEFLERPHISIFDQLLNDANAELEKQQFRHEQYDIHSSGDEIFNLPHGSGFFFQAPTLTNREDDSTAPGVKKVKLVMRRNEFSITSPGSATGGLTRRAIASRRFV
ncbi:hypothetical protein IIB34_02215 [PVC group bacterium]|nr:hypothetical protein [PVC group bacterium]